MKGKNGMASVKVTKKQTAIGTVIIISLILSGVLYDWKYDRDYSHFYVDGKIEARMKWEVQMNRVWAQIKYKYQEEQCIKYGGEIKGKRCYYLDDFYLKLNRKLSGIELDIVNKSSHYKIIKKTPYYKYGTGGTTAGILNEITRHLEDVDCIMDFPERYHTEWHPKDNSKYKLILKVDKLKSINLPDGNYTLCNYNFGKMTINLQQHDCENLDYAEVNNKKKLITFYFKPEKGIQIFDARVYDPTATYNDVLVITNLNSPMSRNISEYFISARNITKGCNISVADKESIFNSTWWEEIKTPVEDCIENNSWTQSINYIVTTKGIPLRVLNGGGDCIRPFSVDSALTIILSQYNTSISPNNTAYYTGRVDNPMFSGNKTANKTHYDMYVVTRLTGNTYEDAIRLVKTNTTLNTTFGRYLLDRDPRKGGGYEYYDNLMEWANSNITDKGKVTLYNYTTDFVMNEDNLSGYCSWGSNDGSAPSNSSTWGLGFNLGAIGETYVSTGARTFNISTASYPQSLIADLVAMNITGVKGYVYEPKVGAVAYPNILFPRYIDGYSLGDSFYMASRYINWMDVIVGDPKIVINPALVESGEYSGGGTSDDPLDTSTKAEFIEPTPMHDVKFSNTSFEVNASINVSNMEKLTYSWNGNELDLFSDRVILYYNLDNNEDIGENRNLVVDLSNGGNNGTTVGYDYHDGAITGAERVDGKYGYGYYFSSESTSHLIIDKSSDLNFTANFTAMAWFKFNKLPSELYQSLMGYGNSFSGDGCYGWALGVYTNDRIYFDLYNSSFREPYSSSVISWHKDEWYHIAVNYNSSHKRIWLNGTLIYETDGGGVLGKDFILCYPSTYDFYIGDDSTPNGHGANATMDEVRFYNKNLNTVDIVREMNSPYPVRADGLVMAHSFEQSTGDWVNDTKSFTKGRYEKGFYFHGNDSTGNDENKIDKITVSNFNLPSNNKTTFATWIKVDDPKQRATLFSDRSQSMTNGFFWIHCCQTWNDDILGFNFANGTATYGHTLYWDDAVELGDWTHIILSIDADAETAELYKNGVSQGSKDVKNISKFQSDGKTLYIGEYDQEHVTYNLTGMMDNIMIMNDTVTANEAELMYLSSLRKYDENLWELYVNQSNVSNSGVIVNGSYTYSINLTSETDTDYEERDITIGTIGYTCGNYDEGWNWEIDLRDYCVINDDADIVGGRWYFTHFGKAWLNSKIKVGYEDLSEAYNATIYYSNNTNIDYQGDNLILDCERSVNFGGKPLSTIRKQGEYSINASTGTNVYNILATWQGISPGRTNHFNATPYVGEDNKLGDHYLEFWIYIDNASVLKDSPGGYKRLAQVEFGNQNNWRNQSQWGNDDYKWDNQNCTDGWNQLHLYFNRSQYGAGIDWGNITYIEIYAQNQSAENNTWILLDDFRIH